MGFFACAFVASLCIPVGMATLTPDAARRIFRWAWLLLIPINTVSCITWTSQGERGFLSDSQWIATGSLLLILSFRLGYAASKLIHYWKSKKQSVPRLDLD